MSAPTQSGALGPLVTRLKACPSPDHSFSEKLLIETWGSFKTIALEHGDALTPAVLAGLILYDEHTFARLLNEAERARLLALAQLALERYRQKTNPPNPLGKLMAASLKELL